MSSPTFKAWILARELRGYREAAGKTQKQAADEIECSPGKITHIEQARYLVKKSDLAALLKFYGIDEQTAQTLEQIRVEANEHGWWYGFELPDGLASYIGLEAAASKVKLLSQGLIPGLLQVEEYARSLHALQSSRTDREIDNRVEIRIRRQTRLISGPGIPKLSLHAVMSEAAIRITEQTPFAEKQLRRLLTSARQANVIIQILPFSAGLHPSMAAGFNILSFEDQIPDVAYEEDGTGGRFVDIPSVMQRLHTTFNKLCGQALPPGDSIEMITKSLQKARNGK